MFKEQNIIVSTDFSDRSFEVIKNAINFAREQGAQLHIVHVVEESFIPSTDNHEQIVETSFHLLKKRFETLDKKMFHCEEGEVEDKLKEWVEKLDAKLVILGSSGEYSAFKDFFMGSYTKSIVKSLDIPVLVVKLDKALEYKNIMVATDLSKESKQHIQRVAELFPNSEIKLFYTYIMPFKNRLGFYGMGEDEIFNFQHELRQKAHHEALNFYESLHLDQSKIKIIVKEGHLDTEFFINEAKSMRCDLLSMHTSGKVSFFAFDLLNDSKTDVLIDKL